MNTVDLVNLALSGDKEAVAAAFQQTMAAKVTDALEIKKVEIASNLLGTEETSDETTEPTIEVDGSSDGSTTDANAEPAAEVATSAE